MDFICTGENDEKTIQAAIDKCVAENRNVFLLNGIYNIDGFYDFGDNGPLTALRFPNCHREIIFKGQNHEYGFQRKFNNGVVLFVTEKALESIGANATDVMRSSWTHAGIQNVASLNIENIAVVLHNNQRALRCVDLRRTDRVEVKNVSLMSYGGLMAEDNQVGLAELPPVPKTGCIGLTMTDGTFV